MSAPFSGNNTVDKIGKSRPKHEVADIFRMYLPSYLRNHKLSAQQFKIVKAILACRTSALGGHIRECGVSECGHEDQSYNSCGDRHCPKCFTLV